MSSTEMLLIKVHPPHYPNLITVMMTIIKHVKNKLFNNWNEMNTV